MRFQLLLTAAVSAVCIFSPQLPAQRSTPWDLTLQEQLRELRQKYGDQPLDLIVVHLGITARETGAKEVARAMFDATGFPTIALPSYMTMPGDDRDRPDTDLFKALNQYLAKRSELRVGYADAWQRILDENAGNRIVGAVFHSGAGIRANVAERDELLAVVDQHATRVCGTFVWAMTDLKQSTEEALTERGIVAKHVGKGDLVSHATRPAYEHLVRSGKGNILGIGTLLGWVKKGPTALFKNLHQHSLTVRDKNAGETPQIRSNVVEVLDLPPATCTETKPQPEPTSPESIAPESLGGIDLGSEIQFRYLEEVPARSELRCALRGLAPGPHVELARGSQLAWESFLVFLALPEASLWANLNPAEPDRVMDPEFSLTEPGHVLLASDLRLKVDLARFTHPDDDVTGKKFWTEIYDRAAGHKRRGPPLSFRVWIVPGEVVLATRSDETGSAMYVVKAGLKVQLESDFRRARGEDRSVALSEDQAFAEKLFRRLVLPRLQKEVDSAPQYKLLREVFYARVLAEWYELSRLAKQGVFADLVDSGSAKPWHREWNPREIFDRYVRSTREGEYSFKRTQTSRRGNTKLLVTRTYFMGGIVLDRVPFTTVSLADFSARKPVVWETLQRAVVSPAGIPTPAGAWFGGALNWREQQR